MAGEDLKDKQADIRSVDVEVVEYADSDDLQLELLGYKSEFKRDFTFLGLFSLVSSELAVLPGVAGTIWYMMGYCGLVGMTWGWLVGAVMGQPLAYSLAELSSAYPTSGGLYHWAYMTAPPKYKKSYAYHLALENLQPLKAAQLLIATCQLAYPDYDALSWHIYLVYVAMMFASYVIICLPTRYVSWFNIWANILGQVVLVVSTILLPIKAEKLNSGKEIFTSVSVRNRITFVVSSRREQLYNQTGWPSGWAFCMSFLAATWTLSGYDVAAHVAEETRDAARTVPLAMVWSTWSSTALGFVYLIALALCATDIDALMANPLGQPISTLTANVLGLRAGIALSAISFVSQFGCGVAFIIAMFYWWFWGYETFTGPRPNLAALRQARGEKADSDSEDIKDSDTKERLEE
ncbi:hypothetical protein EIP86_006790 [Pleurotus ostreatoroseus]|nr:hypothetical protein EIP86_006790 [Pleurotus ostreatoroseus]